MNNYSIDYDDLKHILDVELKDKSYKNYIIKTIESTVIILNRLEEMKNQANTIYRADRQIKRGLGYLESFSKTNEIKYLIKSMFFLEYLLNEELISEPKYSQFRVFIKSLKFIFLEYLLNEELISEFKYIKLKHSIELLNYDSLEYLLMKKLISELKYSQMKKVIKLNEDIEKELKNIILSFECLFFLGKNINSNDLLGFNSLIELLRPPNKKDILIASIYHLTAIQIEWETMNNIHGVGFDIDFEYIKTLPANEKRRKPAKASKYKPYFTISENIINHLFKKTSKEKTNRKMIDLLKYSCRYSYYIYKNEILGIIPSMPRNKTGYSSISDFYSYTLTDCKGLNGFFLNEPLKFDF